MKNKTNALIFVIFLQFLSTLSLLSKYSKGQKRFYHATNMIDILSDNLVECRRQLNDNKN